MSPTDNRPVYLQGEVEMQRVRLKAPLRKFHLYVSPFNTGAAQLLQELRQVFPRELKTLATTSDIGELTACDRCLLYLTSRTWTRGIESASLAHEVVLALRDGMDMLLVHEFPCAVGSIERSDCEFSDFLNDGVTPKHLLRVGIYQSIAIAVKAAGWRNAGLALIRSKLAAPCGARLP